MLVKCHRDYWWDLTGAWSLTPGEGNSSCSLSFSSHLYASYLFSSVRPVLPLNRPRCFPGPTHPRFQKVSLLGCCPCLSLCIPHHLIFHISTNLALGRLTGVSGRPVALWGPLQHMLCLWHVQPITPQLLCVFVWAAAGKNTHSHIYTGASCIWRASSLSSYPKAPWEICKWADAHHCPSYPRLPHWSRPLSIAHTHADLAAGPGSPWVLFWRGVYEYLQLNSAHPHKNTQSEAGGEMRKSLTCLLGLKLFSSTEKPEQLILTFHLATAIAVANVSIL